MCTPRPVLVNSEGVVVWVLMFFLSVGMIKVNFNIYSLRLKQQRGADCGLSQMLSLALLKLYPCQLERFSARVMFSQFNEDRNKSSKRQNIHST